MNFPRNTYLELAKAEGKSPDFIEKTLNYSDSLISKKLPVIFSLKHFAQIIGMCLDDLIKIIQNRGYHYSYYIIKKKRKGQYRRIVAPFKDIKYLQDWIKINILDKVEVHSSANGFVLKKSIFHNAKSHINSDIILNVDLKDFFESITERRVYTIFKNLGYHPNLAVEFAKICTVKMPQTKFDDLEDFTQDYFRDYVNLNEAVLVQGAPTSPALSNIACLNLDNRLTKLANKNNFIYSRYADDLTFSSSKERLPSLSFLKKIIEDEKLKINWDKVGRYKKGQRQMVTGLLINDGIRVPQKYKKEIFRHLHFCEKFGAFSHFNRIAPNKSYRKEWLMGKILFVNSVEPIIAKKMFEQFKKINWEI